MCTLDARPPMTGASAGHRRSQHLRGTGLPSSRSNKTSKPYSIARCTMWFPAPERHRRAQQPLAAARSGAQAVDHSVHLDLRDTNRHQRIKKANHFTVLNQEAPTFLCHLQIPGSQVLLLPGAALHTSGSRTTLCHLLMPRYMQLSLAHVVQSCIRNDSEKNGLDPIAGWDGGHQVREPQRHRKHHQFLYFPRTT